MPKGEASAKENLHKRKHSRQKSLLTEEWENKKRARQDESPSSPIAEKPFISSQKAQKLIDRIRLIEETENINKADKFSVIAKEIAGEEIRFGDVDKRSRMYSGKEMLLDGDDLLCVVSELGQAIDWLGSGEDKAFAFNLTANIVENMRSPADRARGVEILLPCLKFIDRSCYPQGLDTTAEDREDLQNAQRLFDEDWSPIYKSLLRAQPVVGSLDRLIGIVENLEEGSDDQARAGIAVTKTLELPVRGTGNIERFIRLAEIFKGMRRDDSKVQGIKALVEQINSIILIDDHSLKQISGDLDRAAESIGSIIQTIEDPDVRAQVAEEVMPKLEASKKIWKWTYEAGQINEGKTPTGNMAHFSWIVAKFKDEKIPLHGKDLADVISEFGEAIEYLDIQHQAIAFNMLAEVVENIPSSADRMQCVGILVEPLLSVDENAGDEKNSLHAQFLVEGVDRLIGIVESHGEDNDAQAIAGIQVASTLGLPARGTGNNERFIRMAEIFRGAELNDRKVQGINALVNQIGSIMDHEASFEQVSGDLDHAIASIDLIIQSIENPYVKAPVSEEVMPKLEASKKTWELTYEARQITKGRSPAENMARFASVMAKLEDEKIPLHGDNLIYVISDLRDAISRLDNIRDKAKALGMLFKIVGNISVGEDRLRGVAILVKCLHTVTSFGHLHPRLGEDENSHRAQLLVVGVDRLIGIVENFEEKDNDAQARAGIEVASTLSLPAKGTGNNERFIRMAKIFKGTERKDLRVQGINILVNQLDNAIVDDKDPLAPVLADLERAVGSIVSAIASITHSDDREWVEKEVMPKLKAWKLTHEARQVREMTQFARVVEELEGETIPLQGKDLFGVLSGLGKAIERLDDIQHKASAFGMLGWVVQKTSSSADRVRGIEILMSILHIIGKFYGEEDSEQRGQFVAPFLDKLIDLVVKVEEDNGDQARAGLAVLRGIAWPNRTEGGIDRFVRMAAIFERTGDQGLKREGVQALVDQFGSIIESDDDVYGDEDGPLDRASESFDRIIHTITNEAARLEAHDLVEAGRNKIYEDN